MVWLMVHLCSLVEGLIASFLGLLAADCDGNVTPIFSSIVISVHGCRLHS